MGVRRGDPDAPRLVGAVADGDPHCSFRWPMLAACGHEEEQSDEPETMEEGA